MFRNRPELNRPRGSTLYFRATPTASFTSQTVALIEERACRWVPEKSTSIRSPRLRIATCTGYDSESSTPSASTPCSASQSPSGSSARPSAICSAAASTE